MKVSEHRQEIAHDMSLAAWTGLALGPLLLLLTLLTDPPAGMSPDAWKCVGMALMMAVWWSTEAIPIPATSLLPILLVPVLGLGSIKSASAPYANPTIYLFLGGFILGLALEKWNLHKRIALYTLHAVGYQPRRQVAGFMLATALLSMWVSNTATTIMMMPIGLSVIALLTQDDETNEQQAFATALLLGIAYAASIGGIATLIGTPPNALLAAFLKDNYDVHIGFGQWMLLGVPVSLGMLLFTWWWLTRKRFTLNTDAARTMIEQQLQELGPMSKPEKMVAIVFVLTSLAWIFQPQLKTFIPAANDTSIAMAAALALFIIPVDARKRVFLMNWEHAGKVPWGILLLFGGGLSLATVIGSTGLAEWIASALGGLSMMEGIMLMALIVAVITFLTEVTSNTATAAAFLPLLGALAVSQGLPPELLAIPAAIAASCAFMMPVATPPNAIVFGTGHMEIRSMMKAGLVLNLFGIVFVTGMCYSLVGLIWSTSL
ncbi:SLC13 family permease [Laribacter hongkongensis]|uniref:SLC13 family permease n=1 Tax=Laribacter hongkongensis TaxID=168471 RepID=UPI001EFE08B3|nr:DASS family sodium-coupled anion symporter [Laribacter hongkongensis]MCG9076111.1 DASS family sodium-coupled anion symporter [Laribacter hongkongensis]